MTRNGAAINHFSIVPSPAAISGNAARLALTETATISINQASTMSFFGGSERANRSDVNMCGIGSGTLAEWNIAGAIHLR